MESLKNFILQQVYNHHLTKDEAKKYLIELEAGKGTKDIAIIGMSGKFPMAENLEQYWRILLEERNCIREYPKSRYPMTENFLKKLYMKELVKDKCIDAEGNLNMEYQHRGYLESIDKFDADFFGISPREAKAMDPNQRIFLECAYEAMEDGGYCMQSIYGKKVGVFVGIDHVEELKYKKVAADDPMVVTGTWPGILAGRISYIFDFKGPSLVIDTACSSGLVSVHQGCQAIRNGECEMAICGGLSSFIYSPYVFKNQIKELESIETNDDMIRTFDNNAKGTTWGEGVGVVLLKTLDKALAEGDLIHAVIKGSSANNDGASNGLTAPNVDAQQQLLIDAWKDAGIEPETLQYIEAHGTGTVLGDPIEIKSMTDAFRSFTGKKQFCGVGSVKPNIGHLVGASGMASLIKVIKMLENNTMLPSLNFDIPNRFINFVNSPVYINDKRSTWERGNTPRRAGVNSFGFSGTNCHLVLEEAPIPPTQNEIDQTVGIFTISAKKNEVLKELVKQNIEYLMKTEMNFSSLCYTSNCCRGHYGERIAIVAKDQADLIKKLKYISETNLDSINKFGVYYGNYKIVSENKQNKVQNEVTEGKQRNFTKMAIEKLSEFMEDRDYPVAFELCNLYVKGAEVDWKRLYEIEKIGKTRLPYYPLERKSYWFADEKKPELEEIVRKFGTFVDKLAASTMYGDIYITKLSTKSNWVLSDHIILGQNIIPGTTYVEMTCELMRQYYKKDIRIENLVFYSPCIVGKDETREIQSVVVNKGDHFEITYMSQNVNNEWEKHADCCACLGNAEKETVDLVALRQEIKAQEGKAFIREENCESEISLGEHWNNESTDTMGKRRILCRMSLKKEMQGDLDGSFLHVAMFDNAINAVSQDVGEGLYLPYFYKQIEFSDEMPAEFYSHIQLKMEQDDDKLDTITYDVDLIKDDGIIFAKIRDYSTKKVNRNAISKIRNANSEFNYYSVKWVKENQKTPIVAETKGTSLCFSVNHEYGEEVAKELQNRGQNLIIISIGNEFKKVSSNKYITGKKEKDFYQLLQELNGVELNSMIYITASRQVAEITDDNQLKEAMEENYFGVVNLIKSYLRVHFSKQVNLITLGSLANKVNQDDQISPEQSVMGALMKSINMEYENISCKYVDTDTSTDIQCIADELLTVDFSKNIAYRKNERYVAELYNAKIEKETNDFVKENGIYLITGGAGGLGLALAKQVAGKNNSIILVNRSKYTSRDKWDEIIISGENEKWIHVIETVKKIEETGSSVELYQADISNEAEVKKLGAYLKNQYKGLTGIFHCAGNAGDGMLFNRSIDKMRNVVNPKVNGTFLLDKYTRDLQPEFMMLFSSMLTVFGDVGQADYMSANTYMDAFAEYRNDMGYKTKVVNWPAWKEVGMAVDYGVVTSDSSIEPIGTMDAMEVVSAVLNSNYTRIVPGKLKYLNIKKNRARLKMIFDSDIDNKINSVKVQEQEHKEMTTKKVYQYNSEYTETENKLYQIWSYVLQVDKLDIYDNFSALGGDSFLAIQLYKEINKEFPNVIEVSDIFTYPMINKMAEYIDKRTGKKVETKVMNTEEKMNHSIDILMATVKDGSTSIEDAVNMLIKQ